MAYLAQPNRPSPALDSCYSFPPCRHLGASDSKNQDLLSRPCSPCRFASITQMIESLGRHTTSESVQRFSLHQAQPNGIKASAEILGGQSTNILV